MALNDFQFSSPTDNSSALFSKKLLGIPLSTNIGPISQIERFKAVATSLASTLSPNLVKGTPSFKGHFNNLSNSSIVGTIWKSWNVKHLREGLKNFTRAFKAL